MARRPQYETLIDTPYEELSSLKLENGAIEKLSHYVNILRRGLKIRMAKFEKTGEYSYVFDKIEGANLKNVPASQIGAGRTAKERRNLLLQEIARYQSILEAKSATVEGAREINREQDIRIFGVDESGKPRDTFTKDERREYWSLYEEYEKYDPTYGSRYGSETTQQVIADLYRSGSVDRATMLSTAKQRLEELKAQTEGGTIEEIANVYAGRRFNF